MTDTKIIKHKITHKGALMINHAYIYCESENIIAIGIDMKSKYGAISAIGSDENNTPSLYIEAVEGSLNLNRKVPKDEPTEILFPEYSGWNVWSVSISKYTIYLCLVKEKNY